MHLGGVEGVLRGVFRGRQEVLGGVQGVFCGQGLTLVNFSAQRKCVVWDKG